MDEWITTLEAKLNDAWQSGTPATAAPLDRAEHQGHSERAHCADPGETHTGERQPPATKDVTAYLIDMLTDPNVNKQWRAAKALGDAGDTRAVEPLIAVLVGVHRRVAQAAAQSLGKLGDVRAVPALIDTLDDANAWLQESAAQALLHIGPKAIPMLADATHHKSRQIRQRARQLLRDMDAPAAPTKQPSFSPFDPQTFRRLLSLGAPVSDEIQPQERTPIARPAINGEYQQDDIARGLRAALIAVLTTSFASGSINYGFLQGVLSLARNQAALYGIPWVDVISGLSDLHNPPIVAWLQRDASHSVKQSSQSSGSILFEGQPVSNHIAAS